MGTLKQWAKENSNFIKLDDGESFEGIYQGYVFAVNQNGQETPCYKFKTTDGKQKMLQSQNKALCDAFDEESGTFKKNDSVKITRRGLDKNTRYEVEPGDLVI